MKKIVIYECEDGTRFDEFEQAVLYERFSNSLKGLTIRLLGDRTEDVEEARCYLEHPIENVKTFRFEICRIAGLYIPLHAKVFNECGNGTRHISHAERIISDYNYKMLNDAFFRLRCIDKETGREYQQPYYALHPNEWEDDYRKYFNRENKK